MPRAIWTGSISFGLVNVPVKLYSAVDQKDIHFSQFEEGTGAKIRYKRVSEKTGKEVPYEKIVKGYEVSKGRFVIVTPEELESVEPDTTRSIDIDDFVDLEDIDPIFYERTYYLAPAGDNAGSSKAYALLLKAMEEKKKVGVGKFVMRTKQYLAAIRPLGDVLALSTMVFGDEVRDRKEIEELSGKKGTVGAREVAMAEQIIESLSVEWDPSRYRDTYREKVLELIERKAEGEEIVATAPARQEAEVVDLMAALEASLAAAKKGKDPKIAAATSKSAGSSDGDDADYDDMTKDELLDLAKARDIAGRSKMSKDQLVKALRKTDQRAAS